MQISRRNSRRFLVQSILLLLVMGVFSFLSVYTSGSSAYRSANEMGTMTTDYLNLQITSFMMQYEQILEDAAYMVDAMLDQGADPADVEQWITTFSSEYSEVMTYDESGLYGVIDGQPVFSSGWRPDDSYNIYERPWYLQAVEAGSSNCARSLVYGDARNDVRIVSLSRLLSDGRSVLALDIRVGDIEVEWQEGSDVFPGTATIVDQEGNTVLHQQIGREHILCEQDDYTAADYQNLKAQFSGSRGFIRWTGELDTYHCYYITDSYGWTCIVTIPRTLITQTATTLFYVQVGVLCVIFLIILYLSIQNYRYEKRNQTTVNFFEALGQSYFCVALINTSDADCEITKFEGVPYAKWKKMKSYQQFLGFIKILLQNPSDWPLFEEQFSLEHLKEMQKEDGMRHYLEFEQNTKNGPKWVSAEAFPVQGDSSGSQIILAFRLIHETKIRELEHSQALRESLESARTANQAKSDFLSRMSHDMRTPMNAVIGFSELAGKNLDHPEKAKECLDKVSAASHQLLHLINEVLDTAKIEQGKMELHIAPVNLRAHLEEAAALFQLQAKAQSQEFALELVNLEHDFVMTDGGRLDQVLNNLLSNALKYTPPGGSIRLRAEELPGNYPNHRLYRFTVTDTGIGMSPEFLERIFLPFEREDTSMTGQTSGVGLGMAITRSILEMLGGRIDVESTQGEGSSFTVILPCPLAQESDSTDSDKPDAPFSLEGRHFLLVEDNFLNLEIAVELLQMEGTVVTTATNGQEAVETFEANPPGTFEAILMDIQMPVMDGYQAARAIRALPRDDARTIPIFALTANAFEDDIINAREAGMNGHIAKPADMDKIKHTLKNYLDQK